MLLNGKGSVVFTGVVCDAVSKPNNAMMMVKQIRKGEKETRERKQEKRERSKS